MRMNFGGCWNLCECICISDSDRGEDSYEVGGLISMMFSTIERTRSME